MIVFMWLEEAMLRGACQTPKEMSIFHLCAVFRVFNFGCMAIAWGFPNAQQIKMSDVIHYWMFFLQTIMYNIKMKSFC